MSPSSRAVRRALIAGLLAGACCTAFGQRVQVGAARATLESAEPREVGGLLISDIEVAWGAPSGDAELPEDDAWLRSVEVFLTESGAGFTAERAGGRRWTVDALFEGGARVYRVSAIRALMAAVGAEVERRLGVGVFVALDQRQASLTGAGSDWRADGDTSLRFLLFPAPFGNGPPDPWGRAADIDLASADVTREPGDISPPALNESSFVQDGPPRRYDTLLLGFAQDHPDHPEIAALLALDIDITPTPSGYVAAGGGGPVETRTIGGLFVNAGREGVRLHPSAIGAILIRITDYLRAGGLLGVYAQQLILEEDLAAVLGDQDPEGKLVVQVFTFGVTRVRSIASGERVSTDDLIDSPLHKRIRALSPLQPWDGDGPRRDLLNQDELDDYARLMSRHPGRQVDVAIAAGERFGEAEIQYLVRESKPWSAYFQVSNTGTEETDEVRQRFGIIHNQLFGNDDIFSIEYATAGFRESHAIIGSYEAPLFGHPRVRWAVGGGYSEFLASEVGALDLGISGDSFFWNTDLIVNVAQAKDLFIDVFAGVRYQDIRIFNDTLPDGVGQDAIFLPRVGLRAERFTEATSLRGEVFVEWNEREIAATDEDTLAELGRLGVNENFATLKWDTGFGFFLEPLRDPLGYRDPSTPESSRLGSELAFSFRGQYAFNERLIPNSEEVIGGFFSVRGYPESVVAGDTVLVASAEYRVHIPRYFAIDESPPTVFGRPFRVAPDRVYGRPDWDLIVRAFVDAGRTYISQPLLTERGENLVGAGFGGEIQLYRNLTLRADWAWALEGVDEDTDDPVRVGDTRLHVVFTLLF